MADVAPPTTPDGWGAVVAAIISTVAITQVWRPLGGWVARRLDVARKGHDDELSTCRKEIKALEGRFREYQERADGIILKLSVRVAGLEVSLAEREADVAELRAQIRRPRALRHDPILPCPEAPE